MNDPLDLLAAGAISPEIALARLALAGELDRVPADPPPCSRQAALLDLAERHRERLSELARLAAAGLDPQGEDMIAATRALFDRLAREAPEAGVAFYSLGDPALLAAATAELAGVVRGWSDPAGRDVLDLGCGIGRLAIALAPEARSVVGLDLSDAMVAEARARGAGIPNLRFVVGDGRDLGLFENGSFDLIVAADCFPYLVRAGLLDRHVAEAARVLRPGGDLVVFNWSYRGDDLADRAEARALAEAHGFALLRAAERPFRIWDASGYLLRRR